MKKLSIKLSKLKVSFIWKSDLAGFGNHHFKKYYFFEFSFLYKLGNNSKIRYYIPAISKYILILFIVFYLQKYIKIFWSFQILINLTPMCTFRNNLLCQWKLRKNCLLDSSFFCIFQIIYIIFWAWWCLFLFSGYKGLRKFFNFRDFLALHVYQALCYYKLEFYDTTEEVLQVYLQQHPNSAMAINLKACNNFRAYDTVSAQAEMKQLLEKTSSACSFGNDLVQHNIVVTKINFKKWKMCNTKKAEWTNLHTFKNQSRIYFSTNWFEIVSLLILYSFLNTVQIFLFYLTKLQFGFPIFVI